MRKSILPAVQPADKGPTLGKGGRLTRNARLSQSSGMWMPTLACLSLLAVPAMAQKVPEARGFDLPPRGAVPPRGNAPANEPDGDTRGPKRPYAGAQNTGKPPPLGVADTGPDRGPQEAFNEPRRTPGGADRLPSPGERPESSGTGFVVAPGRLITNNHVVAECGRMVARNAQGVRVPARVLATDRGRDLALLSVSNDLGPPLSFRTSPDVRRGETVVTYGFPLTGLLSSDAALTTGAVSALAGLRNNQANFQIQAPVQPGNSGGPLLDSQGNVIGVVVSKLNAARIAEMTGGDIPQNVNFAVKGSEALIFLRANNVEPRTAASVGPDKPNADVGEIANPSTVFLQCFR